MAYTPPFARTPWFVPQVASFKSANGLGGRRGWPHIAYVTRTHGERPHAKFQPPAMTGLAVHKGHPTVQNKGNANIYVD